MKKAVVFLVLGMCVALAFGSLRTVDKITNQQSPRNVEEVVQTPWIQMRNVDANDTPLTTATRAWDTIDTLFYELPLNARIVQLAAYCHGDGTSVANDPNDGSFAYKVYVCKQYGSAQLLGTGTWNVGELELTHNPENGASLSAAENYKWCEATTVTEYWSGSVSDDGDPNDIGVIGFDPLGSYGVYVEVTGMTDVNDVTVVMTWTN